VKDARTGVVPRAIAALMLSAAAQLAIASDPPPFVIDVRTEPTMIRVIPYPDEFSAAPDVAPAVPSCYRVGRCSAHDLHRFRDRPNRLTRLAPQAPPEFVMPPIEYLWVPAPVTPEENILPRYRTTSQVRDEYRAVGTPVGRRD